MNVKMNTIQKGEILDFSNNKLFTFNKDNVSALSFKIAIATKLLGRLWLVAGVRFVCSC